MYYPAGCIDEVQHVCLDCSIELARVRRVAFIHKSYYSTLNADPEDFTLWYNGISNGKIVIFPEVAGDFDGGVPQYTRGYATSPETLSSYFFKVNFTDPDYVGNRNYYNFVRGSRNFHVAYCSETKLSISTKPCTIVPINPLPNDIKQSVNWNIECKWTDLTIPKLYDTPEGIFQCETPTPPITSGIGWMIIESTFIVG